MNFRNTESPRFWIGMTLWVLLCFVGLPLLAVWHHENPSKDNEPYWLFALVGLFWAHQNSRSQIRSLEERVRSLEQKNRPQLGSATRLDKPLWWMQRELRLDLSTYMDESNHPKYTQLAEKCAAVLDIDDPDSIRDAAILAFKPYLRDHDLND